MVQYVIWNITEVMCITVKVFDPQTQTIILKNVNVGVTGLWIYFKPAFIPVLRFRLPVYGMDVVSTDDLN